MLSLTRSEVKSWRVTRNSSTSVPASASHIRTACLSPRNMPSSEASSLAKVVIVACSLLFSYSFSCSLVIPVNLRCLGPLDTVFREFSSKKLPTARSNDASLGGILPAAVSAPVVAFSLCFSRDSMTKGAAELIFCDGHA